MTDQEDTIYTYLHKGELEEIKSLRSGAQESGPDAMAQFEVDYEVAYQHYQADHEMPEEERVQATAEGVEVQNQEAQEVEKEAEPADEA